jgi:hypothetical protein
MTPFSALVRRLTPFSLTRLAEDPAVLLRAETLVRIFYSLLPFLAFGFLLSWDNPLREANFDPIWPLAWAQLWHISAAHAVDIVCYGFIGSSLCGLLFYRYRSVRLLVCVGMWQAHALESSFGAINHQWYPWVIVAFIFIFLPRELPVRTDTARTKLLIVWWAQASMMLLYSMSGFWKFYVAGGQFLAGEVNGFSPLGFAYQVANWVPKLQSEAILAPYIITHPYIAWPFYVLSHVFQLLAFWVMFRPSLQKLWGFELVVFHILTFCAMGIVFAPFIPLLIILLFFSPFTPERTTIRQALRDLPFVDLVGRRLKGSWIGPSRSQSH